MRYGDFEIDDAEGAMLAHSIRLKQGRLPKGRVLGADDLLRLRDAGVRSVVAVKLEADDLGEDDAAAQIANAIELDHLRFSEATTGRVNIYARLDGLFVANKAVVDALNRIDSAITMACLADHVAIKAGDMVATIKIIPLSVARERVREAANLLRDATPFEVKPYCPRLVTLIATELPSLKPSVMDRTAKLLAQRLAVSGSRLVNEVRVPHVRGAVAEQLQQFTKTQINEPAMIVVFGASAVADPEDVIPAAIRTAGGVVERVGMPVDPGNLIVIGRIGKVPVLGAPGCARSPKENGFDWILNRIMVGETVTDADITGMGVGGLLMEIPTRPRPRDGDGDGDRPIAVGSVLLAAGQARRMGAGGPHKLLAEFDGIPLVRRSAQVLLQSDLASVVAVTGYRRAEMEQALSGLDLGIRFNPDYESGMASSLVCGFSDDAVARHDGVLVMLADMPAVSAEQISSLVRAFREEGGQAIVRSVFEGKRGNPIILPRSTYAAVLSLQGDIGARAIIENSGLPVVDVDIGPAAHIDVDTPEAVIAAGGVLKE
ncbi:molybdopterin-binding/glycosyltransferase family 2 protein [Aliirhizobium terrae]|uniref:molybdopterin-binding/glycosyltransferase family 2 protein n=1 Tax=Terrirhizobium terrae TaxID=2926709 RepID=UPI002576D52F|nr:molybdopterin-binding/glycosyltransferase family 2 protein [Rhizobium sp. CC-CFT758]WJH40100.1 molybdopterin-binding/glycosyltransferase family 2 protein [Rhizobium sp. CC-CFT758]